MRKSLVVGILREARPGEPRAPLTPADVFWLKRHKIDVEVESSRNRIFRDNEYKERGAKIVDRFKRASLLIGIKEPNTSSLYRDKVYMVFSHAMKGQKQNLPILREAIKKGITLVDYEKIRDTHGNRLVYFGRFAGICGAVDSLYYLGKRLEWEGIENPFVMIKPASNYTSFKRLKNDILRLADRISKRGFNKKITPFIIGITGHGRVSQGVQEILELLNPMEIHPRDMHRFVQHQRYVSNRVYKIIFHREERFRAKDRKGFYFEDYLKHPRRFESNMDIYIPHLNILMHTSYWDKRYPRLITKEMIKRLYKKKGFRLRFIGDISCDVNGSIELSYKTTAVENPTFTYNPKDEEFVDGYESKGITILARDNLPAELPKDASRDFGLFVREYIYQIAVHGIKDITNHVAIPKEVRQAVIAQSKRLTKPYKYLNKYL